MKVEGIKVYKVDLPVVGGKFTWGKQRPVSSLDCSVVEITTDSGITGYGEVCPLGSSYLPSHAAGVRAGIKELGPKLVGDDPLELGVMDSRMDYLLYGHPDVKSAIDMACWDILGKFCKLPLVTLLGGRQGESIELYRSISRQSADEMAENLKKYRSNGYRRFQLKLGGSIDDDIEAIKICGSLLNKGEVLVGDANTGWLPHEAIRVANATEDIDYYMEQPCKTFDECKSVRKKVKNPFILDEAACNVDSVVRAHQDLAADVICIKISKFGGITKSKQVRDLCVNFGLAMTIDDVWGSDIATAATAHLAHSTPQQYRFHSSDLHNYNTVHTALNGPKCVNGCLAAPEGHGLGVTPDFSVLGEPVIVI